MIPLPATIKQIVKRIKLRRHHRYYMRARYSARPQTEEEKQKNRARVKAWVLKNRDRKKAMDHDYRLRNREKLKIQDAAKYKRNQTIRNAQAKAWVKKHPERRREICSKWSKGNPHKCQEACQRRRVRVRGRMHPLRDPKAISAIFKECAKRNRKEPKSWSVDHIIPMIHGGFHHELNLQLLPALTNYIKSGNPFWQMEGYKSWRDVPEFLWPEPLKQEYLKMV